MKYQQVFVIGAIAVGAVLGSTVATMAYLNIQEQKSAIASPNSAPSSVLPTPIALNAPLTSTGGEATQQGESFVRLPETGTPGQTAQGTRPAPPRQTSSSSVTPGNSSEFSQFRQRLLDAISRRDAKFVRSLVTAQTQWSFGGSIELETYNIDQPNAPFWKQLEKAVTAGCVVNPQAQVRDRAPGSSVWVCPGTPAKPIYNFGWGMDEVAILGQGINVRSEPGMGGRVVGTVSNQLVRFDRQTEQKLAQPLKDITQTPDGWTPIVMNNGQRGWVASQYTFYEPRDYRVSFVRQGGQWRLHYFLRGDGN